jgi:hypothetical protein
MKKTLLFGLVLLVAVSLAGASHASVDNIYEAAIVNMSGNVSVDIKGDGTWITPWIGMKLMKDAVIKTGSNSSVQIVFDAEGLNMLQLNESTNVTVGESMAQLAGGTVTGDFGNITPGSSFMVKTPTAACAIRGTVFRITLTSGREMRVELVNGSMTVQALDAAGNPVGDVVTVPESYQVNVGSDGKVSEPTALSAQQIAQIESVVLPALGAAGEAVVGETTEQVDTKDLDEEKEISPSS